MQGVKHASANVKEKLGNTTAKVEETMDKSKASTAEKTDEAMADVEVGKMEAKQRKHEWEGEVEHVKDQKKVENAQEVSNIKQDVDNCHAAADHAYKDPEIVPKANLV